MDGVVYIKLFVDYLDAIEPLSDAERGRLFTALLEYARTGEVPRLTGNERFLFPMMRAQIDRDLAAMSASRDYLHSVRSEAGRKGGMKKAANARQTAANESKSRQTAADAAKDKDNRQQTIDEDKNIPPAPLRGEGGGVEAAFQKFWSVYPKKRNRADALKAFRSVIKSGVSLDALLSAVEAQRKTPQWTKDGGQYIPYPATWLNRGAWEDEDVVTVSSPAGYEYDPGDLTGSL